MQVLPGGNVVIRNVSLLMIVAAAWEVPFQSPRLTGGSDWDRLKGERYDIEATPAPGAVPPDLTPKQRGALIRPMMQRLLEDRFKLNMRSEAKEQPVYVLTADPGGLRPEKSKTQEKDCVAAVAAGQTPCHRLGGGPATGIHGDAVDIADVALLIENWTDRPVIDKTGLTDLYKIQTEGWAPMRPGGRAQKSDENRPALAQVLRTLGIEMAAQEAIVDMFVVEHVEPPAAADK
jgi:uncharacterized protein (TIGR03435 family)